MNEIDTFSYYNNYQKITQIPYNIITYLFQNDSIFKLLKYNTPDALKQPNLTNEEKASLIYNGQPDSSGYKLFQDPFNADAFKEMCTLIRVYPVGMIPENKVNSLLDIAIEIISNTSINYLDNYSTRILTLFQLVAEELNGKDVTGVGNLFMDRKATYNSHSGANLNIYNNRNYIGYTLIFSTYI